MDNKQSSAECFPNKLKQYEKSDRSSKDKSLKAESGHSGDNKDVGTQSTMHHESSSRFEGSDLLVAEGIAAQQKRNALPSKTKSPKHYEEPLETCRTLRERIKSLEDGLKVRDSIISVILKVIGEGETSIDASVGPINNSLQIMNNQGFTSVYSPKLQNIIQLLKEHGGDSVINSYLLSQINEELDLPDLNKIKLSEMESHLKEKERAIRDLNLELSKRADIIEKNKEDYTRQLSKSSIEIKNLNLKIERLSIELHKKDVELRQTQDTLHKTRNEMEENFRRQFSCIGDFLKDQRGNGETSLKSWLDAKIIKYRDSHENEVACYKKQIETLQNCIKEYELSDREHELELIASRQAHAAHANGYREHVGSIESEYRERIEKLQAEIEHQMEEKEALKKWHYDENRAHHENFSELQKLYTDLEQTYFKCNDTLKIINEELAKKNAEHEFYLNEMRNYESIIQSYEKEIEDNKQQFENDRKQLETYKTEIDSLREQAMKWNEEADRWRFEIDILLDIAQCPLPELREIVYEHQYCEQDIRKMNEKSNSSEVEMKNIKQELLESEKSHQEYIEKIKQELLESEKSHQEDMKKIMHQILESEKSHQNDVAKYKNQILKLKEELGSISYFEERLMIELSNHVLLRDEFKSLFKQTEKEAYVLDNDSLESINIQCLSPEDQNYNLMSEHSSESPDSQEACIANKHRSNISIQPHLSSNADKNRLREALVSELLKEMEGRRLELHEKNSQLEFVLKANNDLNEHCKSLEANYVKLQNFTEEKIDELEGLNNSNKVLSEKIEYLESEKEQLESKIGAISDELSNKKADLESITDLFDFNSDDSGKTTLSLQMKRLFRNVPSSTPNVAAASAVIKFDKSKSNSHVKVIDMIVEQISHFSDLEEENERLKKQIEKMTCEMKENDYLSKVLKSELLSFQEKTQNLEKRLNLLECEKKNVYKFEKVIEQLTTKNKQLHDSQDALQKRIVQLEEENSALERKCNEMKIKFTLDSARDDDIGCETLENLVLEFSKKAEESLSLKEELSVKQESINKLENELDRLRESKNNMHLNIDILMHDLIESEEKLTLIKQNRMDIGMEKRMLEQKLVSLKVKYDQLLNQSERKAEMSLQYRNISINQDSGDQSTDAHPELSCKKQLMQTKSMSSGDWYDNGNVEFAVSSLINLEQEKEFLKQKMKMFEQFLHKFVESDGGRNELDTMKSNLREMYEQLEINYSNFNQKANSLKETNFHNLLTKFNELEKQYKETCMVLNSEKEELQKYVDDLQNELLKTHEDVKHFRIKSEKELFDKDLKIRQAELGLKALKMDNIASSYGLACKSDSNIDIKKQYHKEMEKIHELAISKLKTVYLNQIEENDEKAEQRVRSIEEKYQTQIEVLQQELEEKTLHLHELKSKYLESIFNSSSNEDLKTLAKKKVEFEEKLAVMEKKLDTERLSYFNSLKSTFESYLKMNNACLNSSFKKENSSNIEEIRALLKDECEREKAALKCKIEAQLKEEYKTKVKNSEKEYKNNLNTLEWIIGYDESESTVESRSVVLLNRLLRLVNWEYKTKLQNLSRAWTSKYSEYISNVDKKLLELQTQVPKYTADPDAVDLEVCDESELEKALSLKEKLIKSSEEFYKFLLEFHKTSLDNVLTNMKDAHNEVSSRVDELRLELEKGCLIASLKDKIEDLEKEKEELQCQLKSAIGLLSKDNEIESVNVTDLLKQSSIVGDYIDRTSIIDVEAKVEERLKKRYEEQFVKQRKYFENLVAELGKKFKTDANNSLKTMKQDDKKQLGKYQDDLMLTKNQTELSSSHKDTSRNKTYYEEQGFQLAMKSECSESNQCNNDSNTVCTGSGDLQSREEYLELHRVETMNDVIEEFGLTWKEPDCNLIELGSEKNDSQSGFESKLIHLENEKKELERVIETLSKENNMNENYISVLKSQINEYRVKIKNSRCVNCGKSSGNNELDGNFEISRPESDSFGTSQNGSDKISKTEKKYEYLFKNLQERVDLLAQNLSLEASVKMIVDNVKSSYESDIEQMQFEYDRKVMLENTKNEELIRKFDRCLENIHSQHFFEKEQLKKQMNALVEEYEERLSEHRENVVRLIDSQKNLETTYNEEIKNTKVEIENYLVEVLSDYISKFALQSSITDIEGSKEEFESELKQKTDDIAKAIQTEYENRLEEERRIMLKEFCVLQRNSKVQIPDDDSAPSKSCSPLDLQALEKQISEKYEQKLASLAELSYLKSHYEFRLQQLTEKYECHPAEIMSNDSNCGMTDSITIETLIKERDDLHKVVINLRTAVSDIGKYLLNCEDELNKTLIQSIISNYTDDGGSVADNNNQELCDSYSESENCDNSMTSGQSKHVHFAPDFSTIVEGDFLTDCTENRHDISIEFRNKLEMCMKRLKSEAAAVLGLTVSKPNNALRSVESRRLASVTRQLVDKNKQLKDLDMQLKQAKETIAKYEQDLAEVKSDLDLEKAQREKDKANVSLESVYVDKEQAVVGVDSHFQNLSQLQEKARIMVTQSGESGLPLHTISIVEEMCQHVDHILEEARKEKEDLQSQIDSADKQLRNTRKFLEDQANEREFERDEFSRAITKLKQQLQDKERDWMSKERFASERSAFENGSLLSRKVEALEHKVQETTNLLKETEEKKDEIDRELKEADQKVLVLKDIIRDLECQDRTKTIRQTTLEQRLDELEKELESQKNDQNAMALELEAMQDGSPRDINLRQLEEHFKKQFNPNIVEQMKSQLREMARSIQRQTKYMEGLNVHISSTSLSSPSEDISIREQLDLFKCQTPEGCRSPLLSLPTEEISLLQDQLSRHTKIEEIAMKRIRDQEMQLSSLQSRYEDVLAEREVLQVKCEKQMSTLASTKTSLDEMRRRAEWEQTKCDAKNLEKITALEDELHSLHNSMKNKEREATAYQQQISNLQRIVANKEAELCNYVDSQNNQVEFLQQKLKIMEIEKEKMIVMLNKLREGQNMSLPALMEELLAEKNADIDHLEQMVKELRDGHVNTSFVESQNSSKKSSHSKSKGYRVSFADDVEVSHINDGERTRDAANFSNVMQEFSPHFSSTVVKTMEKSDQREITPSLLHQIPEDESKAGGDFTPHWEKPTSPKYDVVQQEELKIKLDGLQKELTWKTELIGSYEKRLQEIPLLEGELKRARDDLAFTISEISEDKKYYQKQLESMTELQKQLNERESEVQELKDAIAVREENLVRVTSDVKSLQLILEKSQKKIEEAMKTAVSDDTKRLSEEVERLKDENIHHVQEILVLKKQLDKVSAAEISLLKESLSDEQKVSEKLRNEISSLLKEKDAMASELEASKQKYLLLRKELDSTVIKLLDTEKEIDKLQKDLASITELNGNLKKKLHEANQELNLMSSKMSSEISNRVQKDSDDLIKMKDELERLRNINYSLESDCESLKKELNCKIGEATDTTKVSEHDSKIKELEVEIDKLRDEREMLLQSICTMKEKFDTEKSRCETFLSAVETYKNSELLAQEKLLKEKELRTSAEKKSQFLKREYEKMKRAKKELEKKVTVLKDELDKEKKHTMALENSPSRARRTLADLQVTPVDAIEIIPNENKISGSLDDLTDQLQNELDTSARLDDTLLSTLDMKANTSMSVLPSESLVTILQKVISYGFKALTRDEIDHLYEELHLHSHRPPRIAELMERINKLQNEIRKQLKIVDNLHEEINVERSYSSKEKERAIHLETEVDRLQKIISYQEERLASLSSTVEQNRTQMSDLKLSLLKEKGNFKKLHILFEEERDKIKQIQKEDTELIEDLRICLEKEKDSKVRLQLCLEQERERLQTLEAQLNAVAAEQMASRPNQSEHINKCLDEWKGKYTDIGVKLEREKRHVDSLSAALNKEKQECDQLRTELYKKSEECIDHQAEVEQLKCEIGKERTMNREINDKMKTIQEAEIRRQRNRAAAEEKHKRALERAKIQKRDLEVEVARLRTQLVTIKGEEPVPSWTDDVESEPLLNQIKDVNLELEKLGREKKHLTSTVKALLEENEHLELLISQSAGNRIPESELSYFISLYIRSKSHRKALVWQKRYLMLSLQGYQDEGQRLAMKISSSISVNRSWVPQLSVISKPSFKHAALVVIALTRMKKILSYRKEILGIHFKTQSPMKEHLIRRKLKLASPRNDRLLSVKSPVREIEFPTSQRNTADKNEGLLKPTRLADYLETFDKLQARLSQALSPPDNISIGLESKILSKVSH